MSDMEFKQKQVKQALLDTLVNFEMNLRAYDDDLEETFQLFKDSFDNMVEYVNDYIGEVENGVD